MIDFFTETALIREKIRKRIGEVTDEIPHQKLRSIIHQRNKSSSFIKGVMGYLIHEGVGGKFTNPGKVELAAGLEVLCSSGAIFDNAIDGHEERNGETTFLREYGVWMQIAASQYVLHRGLRMLLPLMDTFNKKFSHMYSIDEAVVGMVGMDIEPSSSLYEQLRTIERSNGRFSEVPLVIAATTGTEDERIVENISLYGFNLGTALGVYEEVRDMLGEHGRRRATEIERGRLTVPLHIVNELGHDTGHYVGGTLSEDDYTEMMGNVITSNALRKTQEMVKYYFEKAGTALQQAVSETCFNQLGAISYSVQSELDKMIAGAENKYGQ